MPHIILEYSNNIKTGGFDHLFKDIHAILSDYAEIANCKSRAIKLENYYIGEGDKQNAMINLQLKLLPGRSNATKKEIAEKLISLLQAQLLPNIEAQQLRCSTTIEILDLNEHYYRV